VTFLRKDGCPVLLEGNVSLRFENDQPHSIRAIYRDISERKAAEVKIHQLAYYDKLTGLPNRTLLQDRLVHAIADAKRFEYHLGVVFIDLDHFKKVNDTLGHHIGDLLLQEVAQRLHSSFRENDTAARLGGDEFIVILSGYRNSFNVPHIAQKILKTIGQPCVIEGHELVLSGSVGIAIYPQDGTNAADLLRNADMAMYAAKSEKGDSFQFYSESMNRNAVEQLELENGLRHAIENEQLFICYQSQIDLETKLVVGVEALLRWNHPELGLILPDKFIAVAEETGLIISIGEWVLRRACREIVQLQTELGIELSLSVNVSGIQLEQPNLVEAILNALQESGLPSEQLELEITESVLVERTDQALNLLPKISSLGVRIAIDDFGTGYSSLNYLKNFPIDRLKIDRSFLVDILHEPDNAAIVETIIAMSRNMGLHVIAEGVETHDQAVFLSDRNCPQMQGFLFSKPVISSQIKVSSEQANKLVE
jgi:diguanylate cyclase (GGDEF)-like protein